MRLRSFVALRMTACRGFVILRCAQDLAQEICHPERSEGSRADLWGITRRSFSYSHDRTDIVACLTRQAVHPVCLAASIKGILDSARPTIIGRESLGVVATVIMTVASHQVSSPIEGSNRIIGIET